MVGARSEQESTTSGRRTTLRDVAAVAGVSPKTVSNVVNDYAHVARGTRQRVQTALDALGYQPNLSARHLRRGRSGFIALVVPALDIPYFAELARHVIRAAATRSLTVVIDQTDGDPERERLVLRRHHGLLLDGVVLSPLGLSSAELERRPHATPFVLLGERVGAGPADHVGIDNVAAAHEATRHLIEVGRRRVAAIGTELREPGSTGELRLRGYVDALRAAGRGFEPELARPAADFRREDGATAMRELLALPEPPDAVFAFNDLLALGAMRAALAEGLRVPEDVAIIGFDDIEEARYSTPTLSTVAPDKARIAALAVEMLIARIADGQDLPAREAAVTYTLCPRESTLGRLAAPDRGPST